MIPYSLYILSQNYVFMIYKWLTNNIIQNSKFSLLFSMFLIKNVNKNKLSSNRQKFKNAELQFQKPGSYKKKSVNQASPKQRERFPVDQARARLARTRAHSCRCSCCGHGVSWWRCSKLTRSSPAMTRASPFSPLSKGSSRAARRSFSLRSVRTVNHISMVIQHLFRRVHATLNHFGTCNRFQGKRKIDTKYWLLRKRIFYFTNLFNARTDLGRGSCSRDSANHFASGGIGSEST